MLASLLQFCRSLWKSFLLFCLLLTIHTSLPEIGAYLSLSETSSQTAGQLGSVMIWLSGGYLLNRILEVFLWEGIARRALGRKPPRLATQLIGILIYLLAVSGILRYVFGQPVTALWATSGAVGLVIGFAVRNLIMDTFSGLAIHMERPFRVGDWINCHTRMGDYIGRVEETNWRTTRLWTTDRNLVVIPNSYLTNTLITNFSMPETPARFELDLVLDFSVPSDRALRILSAALISTIGRKGPLANPPPKARVNGLSEYGVQYRLRYFLEPAEVSPSRARNTILSSVLAHLDQAGIALSYPRQDVFLADMPWRHKQWTYLKDQIKQLSRISLFVNLEEAECCGLLFLDTLLKLNS